MKWVDERKRARGPGDLPMAYSEVREPEAGVPVPAGRRSPLTVQDIIDRADVKRSTSLLPLKSKEDLLEGSVAMLAPRSRRRNGKPIRTYHDAWRTAREKAGL